MLLRLRISNKTNSNHSSLRRSWQTQITRVTAAAQRTRPRLLALLFLDNLRSSSTDHRPSNRCRLNNSNDPSNLINHLIFLNPSLFLILPIHPWLFLLELPSCPRRPLQALSDLLAHIPSLWAWRTTVILACRVHPVWEPRILVSSAAPVHSCPVPWDLQGHLQADWLLALSPGDMAVQERWITLTV